ncbi:MAG: AAA family ATPase, partial [Candidatus Diapherotrites archaeon]|nr:AAA family ATPase [Candidatus Diapherotrites archaeon]
MVSRFSSRVPPHFSQSALSTRKRTIALREARLRTRLSNRLRKIPRYRLTPGLEAIQKQVSRLLREQSTVIVAVSGPQGTGKTTAIGTTLSRIAAGRPTPPDWCYVHNFDEPDQPKAIALPAGRGKSFAHDLERFIDGAKE